MGPLQHSSCMGIGCIPCHQTGMAPWMRAQCQPALSSGPWLGDGGSCEVERGGWGRSPELLPHGEGGQRSWGAQSPPWAAAKYPCFRSQESQMLSRDFTATLGRMSHPGRGEQCSVAPAPHPVGPLTLWELGHGPKSPGCATPPTLLLPCLKPEQQWPWCRQPQCGGWCGCKAGALQSLCLLSREGGGQALAQLVTL